MLLELLFGTVFISQIVLISLSYPRRLRRLEAAKSDRAESTSGQGAASLLDGHTRASYIIGAMGLVLLAVLLSLDVADHMTAVLLSIGFYFLLQLSPLALPRSRRFLSELMPGDEERGSSGADAYRSTRLLDVVGALPIGIAAVMFLAYLIFAASQWGGEVDAHLAKMAVFTGSQILFAGSIASSLSSLRRASATQAQERYQSLRRLAPLLVFASIMISSYYFGKELLAALDEPQLRPTMMSAFLQLLAVLAFNALFFGDGQEADPS